jgi:hypothetical protein
VRQPGCPDRSDPMAAPSGGNLSVGRPAKTPSILLSVWWTLWRATTTTRARARAGGDDEERREETCLGKGGVGGSNGLFLFASSSRKGASASALVRAAQERGRERICNSPHHLDVF